MAYAPWDEIVRWFSVAFLTDNLGTQLAQGRSAAGDCLNNFEAKRSQFSAMRALFKLAYPNQ